ncbi:MAG TPA: CoA transferase [Candidatus Acidoferrales bacterium]|nr:CoA transferase [Candidatus Acidoferrales bacterium]
MSDLRPGALDGIRVIEAATLFAGPLAATFLGDLGADVIKIEHPRQPDPARHHGPSKDGIGLWFKVIGRNKRMATLDLSSAEGQDLFRRLVRDVDVVIENFRPGTLERWALGYDRLASENEGLVLARVTGFGQVGPYSRRPGFGTIAEAMSGFAALTGEADGPPTLPPFGLADGVAALALAYGITAALHARRASGRGQVVDLALIEPLLMLLGPQITAFDLLGEVQPRTGNRSVNNAPRNVYRSGDGRWLAVSTSSQSVADRVLRLVGRPDVTEREWFRTGRGRAEHAEELDQIVGDWIAARSARQVVDAFEEAQAAVGAVYDVRDIVTDPQYAALGTIVDVDDPQLGRLKMQDQLFRLSATPGRIRWPGRAHGHDTAEVLSALGVEARELADLKARAIV